MGDIKKQKKSYDKPFHPWQKDRIVAEKVLMSEFGLKNKKELWKVDSLLTKFKDQIKSLTVSEDKQAEIEMQHLERRLIALGLLKPGDPLDGVLAAEVNLLLERRLQTLLVRKGYARSVTQARQFITHRHIALNGKLMTVPGYLVSLGEEEQIGFHTKSGLYSLEHPERMQPIKVKDDKVKDDKDDKKKGKKRRELTDEEKKGLTEEEIEAKEIETALVSEEDKIIERLEKETPDDEVKEIISEGKTELEKLEKKK